MSDGFGRNFLLLQGPHGPFFNQLGQLLDQTGAKAWRVGFNGGDAFFWSNKARFIAHTDSLEAWPEALGKIIAEKSITDIVLYGDTRPLHAEAIKLAKGLGLRIHVFEEGYLRPYWVNYERGGSNGNSRLMGMTVAQMQKVLRKARIDLTEAPAHWGDIRQHAFYRFVYHLNILLNNRAFPRFQSHRTESVAQEFRTYLRRLLLHPIDIVKRQITTRRIKNSGQAYHLILMQLEHDSAFLMHSPFKSMPEFLQCVIEGFAAGAPRHHRLVFKAHPLESGRRALARDIAALAARYKIEDRVHFVPGGKLAQLLDHARSAVTVNSTAGQQALWRGLPLEALIRGKAVTCLGLPFYSGWGLTHDRHAVPRRQARPDILGLIHACLIEYPRYFDPVSRLPCPPEVVVERLAKGADLPQAWYLRPLTKIQGAFASQAHLWR